MDQHHVIDHRDGNETDEKWSVLCEASRIARGKIKNLKEVSVRDFDMLLFPGGYGVVKNLCTFALNGTHCRVHPEVERMIREFHSAGKPIGAICIAPALVAKVLEGQGLRLTIGDEAETAKALETLGHTHVSCDVHTVCVDKKNRVVSTPAYMLAHDIGEAASGIRKLVTAIIALAKEPVKP